MKKILYYIEKYKKIVICLAIVILVCLIIISPVIVNGSTVEERIKEEPIKEDVKEIVVSEENIKVDIKGMVKTPGVYELKKDSRIIDAINNAGGLIENANTEYINLSKKLEDEMIIIIYSNEELGKFKEEDKQIIYIEYKCDCPDNINDACINENDKINTVENNSTEDQLISINTATIDELTTLSGIGDSKAKEIIRYREENGLFENIEDIMNVSGIGQSAYSKIKDYIKI